MKDKKETKAKKATTKKVTEPKKKVTKAASKPKAKPAKVKTESKNNLKKEIKKTKQKKVSKFRKFYDNFSDHKTILDRLDLKVILVLVVLYGILAFINLGTLKTPKTYYKFDYSGEEVGIELKNGSQHISKMRFYTGPEVGTYMIVTSTDGEEYHNLKNFTTESVFVWQDIEIDADLKFIKFVAEDKGSYLLTSQIINSRSTFQFQ